MNSLRDLQKPRDFRPLNVAPSRGLADRLAVPTFGVDTVVDDEQVLGVNLLLDGKQFLVVTTPLSNLPILFQDISLECC